MKINKYILIILLLALSLQATNKRSRGEGLYQVQSANTIGHGNIWAEFTALGFIWDSGEKNELNPLAFPEISIEGGLFDKASIYLQSRLLSYGWKFDWISIGAKFTFFKNKNLNLHNLGAIVEYKHRFLKEFSSIGGYRIEGTGFSPEGFIVEKGSITIKALYDLDLIVKNSRLPFKVYGNLGARIHLNKDFLDYSQYLIDIGFSFSGTTADVFIEYSLNAFFNTNTDPKKFSYDWGWDRNKTWEVAFTENPMYITLGGRIRYSKGAVLYGAVPLLLSYNQGSDITYGGDSQKIKEDFPDENARGITDPFDPWYAKWKVILKLSYPIRYRQTSSELKRSFLLRKNRKVKKKIDIDERLNILEEEDKQKAEELDRQKRLEEIRKKREEIEESEK